MPNDKSREMPTHAQSLGKVIKFATQPSARLSYKLEISVLCECSKRDAYEKIDLLTYFQQARLDCDALC